MLYKIIPGAYQRTSNLDKWRTICPELDTVADRAYTGSDIICPDRENVFRSLEMVGPGDVRVLILGQDPYHSIRTGPGIPYPYIVRKANGLSFGYNPDWVEKVDSSLATIVAELDADTDTFDLSLRSWAEQGVLLLNTRLTVVAGKPLSHAGIGWEKCIYKILEYILVGGTNPVLVAWGNEAYRAYQRAGVGPDHMQLVRTSHPCRYSNTRGPRPFSGSRCFDLINDKLVTSGRNPINWTSNRGNVYEK